MSEHSYFVFDPEVPEEAFVHSNLAYIPEWSSKSKVGGAIACWAEHSYIDGLESSAIKKLDSRIRIFPKSHASSLVLRAASHPLYLQPSEDDDEADLETIGCFVSLPERLSERQIQWLDLIDPPYIGNKALFIVGEYELLKHLKVVSGVHPIEPVRFKRLKVEPLAEKLRKSLSLRGLQLASLKPMTAQKLLIDYAWWFGSLNSGIQSANNSYKYHCLMHANLLLRYERLNQLKAIVYSRYYSREMDFIGRTHTLKPDWIAKNPTTDATSLFLKAYGTDGWFVSGCNEDELPVALLALATTGHWSVDSEFENPVQLLQTTVDLFEYAHQSDDKLANKLHRIIHEPENPFDMLSSIMSFNELMPVLASVCRHDIAKAQNLAALFDDDADGNLVYQVLSDDPESSESMGKLIQTLLKGE